MFKPLVASLDLTHRAATQSESQAASRAAVAQVENSLSLAEYVLDPTMGPINLWLTDRLGNPYLVQSQFTMMEYIPAALALSCPIKRRTPLRARISRSIQQRDFPRTSFPA